MATTERVMVVEEVVPHFMDGTSMDLRLDLTHLVAPDNLPSHRRHLSPNHKVRQTRVAAGCAKRCDPKRLKRF